VVEIKPRLFDQAKRIVLCLVSHSQQRLNKVSVCFVEKRWV